METNKITGTKVYNEVNGIVPFQLAFEDLVKPTRRLITEAINEENEKRKREVAFEISSGLINGFNPEDRFDIFSEVRSNLEAALKEKAYDLHSKIETDVAYLDMLKNLIY
jgi:hypothetical protein